MERKFQIELFRMDGSPVTKKQVEALKPGDRLDYLIGSELPLYGYFAKGKTFQNLFVKQNKQLSGFLLVGCPAPDSDHITVCEFNRGLIHGFEVALTHFDGRTDLIVYPAWQAAFSGNRQNIKINGVTFEGLVNGLKGFIFHNISRIPTEPWNIKFHPYQKTTAGKKMKADEIFIQRFKPHTGFGTALTKWGKRIMLDHKSIADIFSLKEGSCVPATITKLQEETKHGITHSAIIGATTAPKMAHQDKLPVKTLGEIFDLSKLKGKIAI